MTRRSAVPRVLPTILLALAAGLPLTGCERPEDQETGSIDREDVLDARADLSPELQAALDSGNAAYRIGDYDGALEHYREVVEGDDGQAAGWFGIYMAELALGNTAAADSAMLRARELAPGASLIHPETDTAP